MLSERERRLLEALERRMGAEDPRLARLLTRHGRWLPWRAIGRRMVTVPALVVATGFAVAAFALHVSSLELLFLPWVAFCVVRLLRSASAGTGGGHSAGSRSPGHRAGWP